MLVVTGLLVTGCASSAGTPTPVDAASSTTTATVSATPTPSELGALRELSDFSCTPSVEDSDLWTATGTLTNSGPEPGDFQVTVAVVDASGGAASGNERTVALAAGDSADIDMGRVRGPADGTCQVRVLRMP